MAGYICMEGGAEFGGAMAEPDRRSMELAGGKDIIICILPTAAAPDHNDRRAGSNGQRWFTQLGATQVVSLPVIDRASANRADLAKELSQARLIYLLGGFPAYLANTLKDSLCWQAILQAHATGAVIAGSSAGAMVLCQLFYDPERQLILPGLGLLPGACVLPHHNNFGKKWASGKLAGQPVVLIGIDEQTGIIDDAPGSGWCVYGKGSVSLYTSGQSQTYPAGAIFNL